MAKKNKNHVKDCHDELCDVLPTIKAPDKETNELLGDCEEAVDELAKFVGFERRICLSGHPNSRE